MEKDNQQKAKRRRINTTHRWTDAETVHLIEAVADATRGRPESFEKPTAERFYARVKSMACTLERIEWMSLKGKMRYLKASYVSAVDWKNKTGSGLLASGDETSVTAYIRKICPHFDLLADIFGQRKNVSPPLIFDSQIDATNSTDHCYSVTYAMSAEQDSIFEPLARSQTSTPEPVEIDPDLAQYKQKKTCDSLNAQPSLFEHGLPRNHCHDSTKQKRISKPKKMCATNSFNDLLVIQENKLKLEVEKLELEKEREKNKVELRALELKNEIELKKMELEMQKEEKLQIEKLRLESAERLRKYEIDSKAQNF